MTLLDRHIEFVEALRAAGLPVSLSEGLDAVRAVEIVGLADRVALREAYAATLVKRAAHRLNFDTAFDLFFPALQGEGYDDPGPPHAERSGQPPTDAEALADLRERLRDAFGEAFGEGEGSGGGGRAGEQAGELSVLAREAVGRFGRLGNRPGDGPQYSSYAALRRVDPGSLTDDPRRLARFEALVEAEARRRQAEQRGASYVADYSTRPPIEQLAFTSMKRADLEEMRREIYPLARRLATRLTREQHARRRGPLDVRRTIRASMSTGGVPVELRNRPKRPGRTDLVVLCDVSGSVANFASFTLLLVFALREQFSRVRAFTFVDDVTEVTRWFEPGADVAETMTVLAESARQASIFGRTNYGRAFRRFREKFPDALTPKTSLLILGDARSNYADLHLDDLRAMAYDARHAWWLNPEHGRQWGTGDSAAPSYGEIVPMVECRNLVQLAEFIHDIA